MDRRYYIYIAFRPWDGSPCYVGKGAGNRWRVHLSKSHNRRLRRIVAKAGGDIPIIVIRSDLTELDAFEIEIALIRAIGRYPNGPLVNMTDGGEGPSGSKQSAETIEKRVSKLRGVPRPAHVVEIIAAASRGLKRSEEVKAKLRGPKSDAHRAKLRARKLGSKQTAEHVEARIAPLRGRLRPPDVGAAISAGKTGKSPRKYTRSPETVARQKERARDPQWLAKVSAGTRVGQAMKRWRALPVFVSDAARWGDGASAGLM